ncbi:MAG: DUF4126 domain-containing protein [Deltaproteobacteria bacterium]|nr:DUF4126 domain-containing protein [Deltaproteobacteria bacterium]
MGLIEVLSLALGSAWTSGINLYATVFVLGIAGRTEMINLPQNLEVLSHPAVIAVACVMYLVEFFADKIPYLDSGWDALHTFIRIPAGALLAAGAVSDLNPALEMAALLAGGTVAATAHGVKATTRLAINTSPEPFTNWTASVAEDAAVVGGVWMIFNYPYVMLGLLVVFIALTLWLLPKFFRKAKQGFQALRGRLNGKPNQPSPPAVTPQLS